MRVSEIISQINQQVRQVEEDSIGWAQWDEHYQRMQDKGYTSATATLVANDEMARAGWIRFDGGWKRVAR